MVPPWVKRATGYLAVSSTLGVVAFGLGSWWYDAHACDSEGGYCDLASLEGLLWATGALMLCLIAVGLIELTLWGRRRRLMR